MERKTAIVIGSGFGGIACAMRLQSLGFNTRSSRRSMPPVAAPMCGATAGFTFDMGPTVLTVPHLIEELFSLEQDHAMLGEPDFPAHVLGDDKRITQRQSAAGRTPAATSRSSRSCRFTASISTTAPSSIMTPIPKQCPPQITALAPEDLRRV